MRGTSVLSRVVNGLLRLPRASEAADVRLEIVPEADGESWRRTFDGVPVTTWQRRPHPGLLIERTGRFEFRFRLVSRNGETWYEQTRVALRLGSLAVQLPSTVAPIVEGRERARSPNVIDVRVRVTWPPAGLILEYDGDVHIEDHP